MELNNNSDINYFFVDESGDPTFYNKKGREPCLQITDYINWAVYRAFIKGKERYINYIIEK
jgi:hypothetical protein